MQLNNLKFGIPETTVTLILNTLRLYPEIQWVKIYGSRALGTYQTGSDIDIAYSGPATIQASLRERLEDLSMPYTVDVTHYEGITEKGFKHHINNYGVLLFKNDHQKT